MTFLAGMTLGLSLIIAIGAQNVFVLRQGLRREHVGIVVAICAASDALLIGAGVAGVGSALASMPALVTGVRWAGAAFLVGYAVLAARRAWRPQPAGLDPDSLPADPAGTTPRRGAQGSPDEAAETTRVAVRRAPSRRTAVVTCLALTWLNPHVYLDTVLLLGTIAASHGEARGIFGAGAIAGSVVWFTALGYGARWLGRWLERPSAWRVLDAGIAIVMLALAVMLATGA